MDQWGSSRLGQPLNMATNKTIIRLKAVAAYLLQKTHQKHKVQAQTVVKINPKMYNKYFRKCSLFYLASNFLSLLNSHECPCYFLTYLFYHQKILEENLNTIIVSHKKLLVNCYAMFISPRYFPKTNHSVKSNEGLSLNMLLILSVNTT